MTIAASASISTTSEQTPTNSNNNGLSSPGPTVSNYYVSDSPTPETKPKNKSCSQSSQIQRNSTTYQQTSSVIRNSSTPLSAENSRFFYHPAPSYPLIPGQVLFPTHPMYPLVLGALPKPDAVVALTELMDATKLNDNEKDAERKTPTLNCSKLLT